ncbi:hypothetical protein J5Y09_07640 [Roseomonas sp. PWR1]|uniref:LCCL domain-containing protein n=1 Tax=Roseomonas nitratireducens TaxID=2820810 RepID=A0ABS4AQZ2_9PROT|nr:LCCL domain-containing protein [Neoroseomonas nitratireducens]MBP0463778.1 hypothetical protein [Neoroseomonas nitratireducens]
MRFFILPGLLLLLAAPAMAQAPCPADFQAHSAPLVCSCSTEAAVSGKVWGTGDYTTDSRVCRAAVHAGAIPVSGGLVMVSPAEGRPTYTGTTQNGVTTTNYGPWPASFNVDAIQSCPETFENEPAPMTCSCTAEAGRTGTVWGTGTYTTDSRICRAAIHAGAITSTGGVVLVTPAPGQQAYRGSAANGVTTTNYGPWGGSFTVAPAIGDAPAPRAPAAAALPACPADFEGRTEDLACRCSAAQIATGTVYGTGIFTADSAICRAARQSGVIGPEGGPVSIVALAGQDEYFPSTANGITTLRFGPYGASFSFRR